MRASGQHLPVPRHHHWIESAGSSGVTGWGEIQFWMMNLMTFNVITGTEREGAEARLHISTAVYV
jgi:hypothetical protein